MNHFTLIAENNDDCGAFVGRMSNGKVRVGYRGMAHVDSAHKAFLALADRAHGMIGAELEDAVEAALKARNMDRGTS
jgi:hypothetical protein